MGRPNCGRPHRLRAVAYLTDTYLPQLDQKRVALLSNLPCSGFLSWTYRERYPNAAKPELPVKDYDVPSELLEHRLQEWAGRTEADAVVCLNVPPGSPEYLPVADYRTFGRIAEIISSNPRFRLFKEWQEHGCTISLWLRQ